MVVLLIFFQDNGFSNRVINTATVLIAFSAYYTIIRGAMPKSAQIILIEYIVYAIMFTCALQLIQAMTVRKS